MSVREVFDSGIWKGYPVMWGESDDEDDDEKPKTTTTTTLG
jgi:hypothetical protein